MNLQDLYSKAARFDFLTQEEGLHLYHHAPLADLIHIADELRKQQVPHGKVTWQIDRNVNTTNVCIANCKFVISTASPATQNLTSPIWTPTGRKSGKRSNTAVINCCCKADIIRNWD